MKKTIAILLAFMMLLAFSCKQASSSDSGSSGGGTPAPTDTIPPAPVTEAKAIPESSTIALSWENPSDEDFEKVLIVYGEPTKSVEVAKPENSTVIEGFESDGEYTFTLYAVDTSGNKSSPVTASATIDGPPPQVTNATAVALDHQAINITWTDPVCSDLEFIEIRIVKEGVEKTETVLDPGTKSYLIDRLSASTEYTVKLIAYDASYNKSEPVIITVTTLEKD